MKNIMEVTMEARDLLSPKDLPALTKEETKEYSKILTLKDMQAK